MSDNDDRDLIRQAERIVWVAGWHLQEDAVLAQLADTRGLGRGRLEPRSDVIQLVTYDGEHLGHVRRQATQGPDGRWVAVLRHQACEIGSYGSAEAAALALAHACGKPAEEAR